MKDKFNKKINSKDISSFTLADKVNRYLRTQRTIKESTMRNYQNWARILRTEKAMQTKLTRLTTEMIQDWYEDLSVRDGYSYSTINGYHSALVKPALDLAVLKGAIPFNPAIFKLTSVISKKGNKGRELTEREVEVLIDYLDNSGDPVAERNRGFIKLLLATGLRISELCGITVDDIDLENRELTINKQLYRKYGYYSIEDTKSKAGHRVIPLTDMAIEAIEDIFAHCNPVAATISGYTGFILPNSKGMPAERNSLYKKYKNLMLKIDEQFGTRLADTSLHSLRHTFCSKLIRSGVSLKVVQYIMGHSSAQTTLDIYTHVMRDNVKSEIFTHLKGF